MFFSVIFLEYLEHLEFFDVVVSSGLGCSITRVGCSS